MIVKEMNELRKANKLTHIGVTPNNSGGDLIWGLRLPDRTLFIYRIAEQFTPIWQDAWEKITEFQPPWPWNEEGTALVIKQ